MTQPRAEPSQPPCGLGRWVSGAAGQAAPRDQPRPRQSDRLRRAAHSAVATSLTKSPSAGYETLGCVSVLWPGALTTTTGIRRRSADRSASRRMATSSKPVPKSAGIAPNPTECGRAAIRREKSTNGSPKPRNRRGDLVSRPALHAGGRRFDPCTAHYSSQIRAFVALMRFTNTQRPGRLVSQRASDARETVKVEVLLDCPVVVGVGHERHEVGELLCEAFGSW